MYSSSNANTFNWDKTTTLKFIKRRIKEDVNFNGKPNSATVGYMTIVQDLGIPITEKQARSKWQNLVYKYKELKRYLDGSDEGYDKAVNSWPFFDVLDKFFTKKQILSFHNSPDENDEFIKTNFLSNNGSPANNSSFHQDFSVVNTDWIKNEIIDENEENFETDDFNDEMAAYQHHHSQNLPNLMSANHSSVPGRPENLNRQTHNNNSNTSNNNNNNSNNHNNHVNNNINTSSNNNGHHNHNNHNNISNGNKMNNEDNHQFLKSCKYEDSAPSRDELKRKALKRRLHHDPVFPPNNSSSNGPTNPPPLFFPTSTPNNHPPPLAIIDPSDDNFDDIMFQPNISDTAILKEIHEIKEVVLKNNEYIQNLNDRTKSIENKLDLVMAALQKMIERDQPKIKIEDNSNSSLSFPEEFKKFNGE